MGVANSEQVSFRARDDDVTLNSVTFTYTLNADWTQDVDVAFRVRFLIEEDAGGMFNGFAPQLQHNHLGGGYTDINASSSVMQAVSSGNFTDEDATTQVLGAGSFVTGRGESDDGLVDNTINLSNQQTEIEFCVQIIGADVADEDTINLRVTDAGTVLDVYTQTPTITVNKAAVVTDPALLNYQPPNQLVPHMPHVVAH